MNRALKNPILQDKIFWFLLVFACFYIIGNIGTGSLTTWDECYYSLLAREMQANNTFHKLTFFNSPFLEKPPLYIWLTALSYKAFGISEFSSRITSAVFGVLTVLLTYSFGRRLSGKRAGLVSALILLALPHYLHFSKLAMLDTTLTFFITFMVYAFIRGEEDSRYLFLSAVSFGLAYFTKGFAAFLGLFIVSGYALLTGKHKLIISRNFIMGIVVSVSAVIIWYTAQYLAFGMEQVKSYFDFHILQRASRAIEGHMGGINFYQKAIFNKNKPWCVILFLSFAYMLFRAIKKREKAAILLSVWAAASYILYSLVKTKLHWYIMPVYPALALSSGIFIVKFLKNRAFYLAVAVILIAMILQIPYSWAFRIDFSPDEKAAALFLKSLPKDKKVYMFGEYDNNDLFYFGDIIDAMPFTEKIPYFNSKDDVYFVLKRGHVSAFEKTYKDNTDKIKLFNDIVILKNKQN
jgi:4-amino-4-deoxy-L-arabinose transferase-like glycosyltransferase